VSSLARGPRVTPGCVSPMLRAVGSHWDCRRHAAACVARVRLSRVCTLHAPDARAQTLRCAPGGHGGHNRFAYPRRFYYSTTGSWWNHLPQL